MKKFTKVLMAMAVSLMSLPMAAADHNLVVNFTDGTSVEFSLGEEPVLTYSETHQLIVTTATGNSSYEFDSLVSLTFKEVEPDGIDKVNAEGFKYNQQTASFTGLEKNSEIRVFDANGRLIQSQKADKATSVNLSNLPAGIYIVKFGNQSFKVKK